MFLGPDTFNPDDPDRVYTETPENVFISGVYDFILLFDISDIYHPLRRFRITGGNKFRRKQ